MKRGTIFSSALLVASLSMALPAGAQDRRDGRRGGERANAGQSAPRQDGARAVPREQARGQAPDRAARPQEQRAPAAPQYRADDGRAAQQRAVPRQYERPSQAPAYRGNDDRPYRGNDERAYRDNDDRRGYSAPRGGYAVPRSHSYSYSRPFYARPYSRLYSRPYNFAPYRPYYFARPYYSFHPRFSIGFGLWLGDPIPYPWAYLGTYRPRVYGYYQDGVYPSSVSIYGGVSFDIQPSDADLFVDGEYVGTVDTFNPSGEPLTLTPGVHRISIQRDGFRPMEWDVTVQPGQVIPFRGDMEQY